MTVNNSKSTEIYEKIGSLTGLVTPSIRNTKVPEIENKIKTWCLQTKKRYFECKGYRDWN